MVEQWIFKTQVDQNTYGDLLTTTQVGDYFVGAKVDGGQLRLSVYKQLRQAIWVRK